MKEAVVTVKMRSQTNVKKRYLLTKFNDGTWFCTCPSFRFQKKAVEIRNCKHIRLILN